MAVLNISYNKFTGRIPDTPFFAKLPLSVLAGNPELCFSGNECGGRGKSGRRARMAHVPIPGPSVLAGGGDRVLDIGIIERAAA